MEVSGNILITGTTKGIGKYLAEYYLSRNFMIFGTGRSESAISHPNYCHIICDVSIESEVKKCISEVKKQCNKLDVLINNAGVAALNHTLLTPTVTIEKVFDTNFKGTFLFSREAGKWMQKTKGGRIINFTTVAVPLNLEGEAIYASSKSAVETLTRIMAKELGSFGITVNAIGPCPTETNLIKTVPKNKIQILLDQQAIKRYGEFKDISNVIDFFIKQESNFITGQTIYLGGVV
jgi:3-oxoacyl-[acyl-carrier protein] reductase